MGSLEKEISGTGVSTGGAPVPLRSTSTPAPRGAVATSAFGKYTLIAELGRGGMADVFLAVQAGPAGSGFRKLIVVKRLRDNLAEDPQFVQMLGDEARIAARLNHPHVVQTYEVGQVEHQHFIAMEYLDGQPLHRIQYRAAKKDVADGAEPEGLKSPLMKSLQYIVLVDVAAGLHHAHTLKDFDGTRIEIVHRDVTPQNIFVTYEGSVKVVDFGIAKAAGRAQETAQGVVKGKIRYMAPEQALGLPLDARADIYSLGVMLWEATTGQRMWQNTDDIRVVTALASGEIPSSPRDVDPSVPEALDAICKKALARDRDDRYATAEEFRVDLEQYLAESGQLISARRMLGPKVAELFKDKRREIEVVIEKCLAKLADGQPTPPPMLGPLDANASSSMSLASGVRSGHSAPNGTSIGVAGDSAVGDRPRRSGLAVGIAAVAVLGIGVLAWSQLHRTSPLPGDTTGPAVSSAPAAAVATVAGAGEITLHIMAIPSGARISIDEAAPVSLPLTMRVKRDDLEHRLHIEADGYEPRDMVARFASDQSMNIELTKSAGLGAGRAAPPRTAPNNRPIAQAPAITQPAVVAPSKPPAAAATPPAATATTEAPPAARKGKPGDALDRDDPWSAKH